MCFEAVQIEFELKFGYRNSMWKKMVLMITESYASNGSKYSFFEFYNEVPDKYVWLTRNLLLKLANSKIVRSKQSYHQTQHIWNKPK